MTGNEILDIIIYVAVGVLFTAIMVAAVLYNPNYSPKEILKRPWRIFDLIRHTADTFQSEIEKAQISINQAKEAIEDAKELADEVIETIEEIVEEIKQPELPIEDLPVVEEELPIIDLPMVEEEELFEVSEELVASDDFNWTEKEEEKE